MSEYEENGTKAGGTMGLLSDWSRVSRRRRLGLELTDREIKIAEVECSRKAGVKVTDWAVHPIPSGILDDGLVQDRTELIRTLKRLVEQHQFASRRTHVALPSPLILVRYLQLPPVSRRQLDKLIRFEVNHRLHLPFAQPVYDYIHYGVPEPAGESEPIPGTMGGGTGPDRPLADVMLVAASRELVMEYVNLLRECGLDAVSVDMKALALDRLVQNLGLVSRSSTYVLADVNDRDQEVSIFHRGQLKLTRTMQIELGTDKNGTTGCRDLAYEMEHMINFYRYTLKNRHAEIHHILLTGSMANLRDVADYLEEHFGCPVNPLCPAMAGESVQGGPATLPLASIAVAAGLALGGRS